MTIISTELLIDKLKCEIYPITIIKFVLNIDRLKFYFSKPVDPEFKIRDIIYNIDNTNCEVCNTKKILCRKHNSLSRVLNATQVAYDVNMDCYFFKNEIFKLINEYLVIVYCPHTKLIEGPITQESVKKVIPTTFYFKDSLPNYNVIKFNSNEVIGKKLKAWFNKDFSIITEEKNFVLATNK